MFPIKMLPFVLLNLLFNTQTSQSLRPGSSLSPVSRRSSWESPSGRFSFGFYQDSRGYAVGIWLSGGDGVPKNTVVWTANRDDPPLSSRAAVNFTAGGKLMLWDGEAKAIAGIPESLKAASASILDSGNFVLYDEKSRVIWQTFDHPTDTILGGQKLNVSNKLVSSPSASDHSSGRFLLIMQRDENLVAYPVNWTSRSAYWASDTFSFHPSNAFLYLERDTGFLRLIRSPNTTIRNLRYTSSRASDDDNKTEIIYRATIEPDGNFVLYSHSYGVSGELKVEKEWSALQNLCDNEAYCGVNSYCSNINGFVGNCTCFPGFLLHTNLKASNSPGCYPGFLDGGDCQKKELYEMTALENIEWEGSPYSGINSSKEICSKNCLEDCDCWGALFDNGSGTCNKYKLPIISAVLNTYNSYTAFTKSLSPVTAVAPSGPQIVVESKKQLVWMIGPSMGSFAFLCSVLGIICFFFYRRRVRRYQLLGANANQALISAGEFTLRSFSYDELEKATDGFKEIIGTNSCGAVYKGSLSDQGNRKIAVKTLENVEEGESKFRTEMTAVGRTHHKNLVQLLGFCVEGSRKLLVYEFMKNGSLADFLFKGKKGRPTWKERETISLDVARGILYLHEECESRIIHCNIKPQNILLSDSWTAKISEFGLAKLLMNNQSGMFTGTKGSAGHMAPEWQKTMSVTEKADVYSFGVVLLEIICCKSTSVDQLNVTSSDEVLQLDWVYDCFSTNNLVDLVGDEEVDMKVLERMVKVGLLCLEDDANLRPAMKNVILMLEGTMNIPEPQP